MFCISIVITLLFFKFLKNVLPMGQKICFKIKLQFLQIACESVATWQKLNAFDNTQVKKLHANACK